MTQTRIRRLPAFLGATVTLAATAHAQAPRLIPTPQKIEVSGGAVTLGRVHVDLAKPGDPEDRLAAQQLMDEAKVDLTIGRAGTGSKSPRILIGRIGRDKEIDAAVGTAAKGIPKQHAFDGYVLVVQPDKIVVAGQTAAGTFYGVQTLKQLIRRSPEIPCMTVVDWAALQYRGWQDDVSRGPIPTLDFLKREVRTLSEFKLNAFTLYTEHVFKLKKHPTIAPKDGITAEEIAELSAYAAKYHVELIGNFQSFGHFANILATKGYENLGETPYIISPAKPESYKFLADVYGEIAPAYKSTLFDINCDETGGLGSGASKDLVAQIGVGGVYAMHINRIAELLKALGKTPMMWGDIALEHPDIVPRLPKDLIVLSWGYDARPSFDGAIVPFTKLGFRFWVCPGVSCWSQIFPDYDNAAINISNYVRDGARLGAMGTLDTTWDDDGQNFFSANWVPLVWGAECAWHPAIPAVGEDPDAVRNDRLAAFRSAFSSAFFGLQGDQADKALWDLSELRRDPVSGGMWDGAFDWSLQDVQGRRFSLDDARDFVHRADALATSLNKARAEATHNADSLDYAAFEARRASYLGTRGIAAKLMDCASDPVVKSGLAALLSGMSDDLVAMARDYRSLWLRENRPWWLDKSLQPYIRARQSQAALLRDTDPEAWRRRFGPTGKP